MRFWDPAVSCMKFFVTKVSGFWLIVIVTKDLVLDVAGVLYPLLFTHLCFPCLMLIFICYDCYELIINMSVNVYLLDLKTEFISLHV